MQECARSSTRIHRLTVASAPTIIALATYGFRFHKGREYYGSRPETLRIAAKALPSHSRIPLASSSKLNRSGRRLCTQKNTCGSRQQRSDNSSKALTLRLSQISLPSVRRPCPCRGQENCDGVAAFTPLLHLTFVSTCCVTLMAAFSWL